MSDRGDFELLREYAEHGSQPAFAELVGRYVDLVYSSAARQVCDSHAAEDVTQAVFIVLARKAREVRAGSVLSAWLLGVTRFASKDHLKRARRRQRYEQAAALERTAEMVSAQNRAGAHVQVGATAAGIDPGPAAQQQLTVVLDDALARLSTPAREALVLRFFEKQSFKEVGDRLGISEVAARQRVFRGLERLRGILGRRGVSLGGESLALALAATAVLPAPGALGASVATVATSIGAAAQYGALVKGTVSLMKFSSVRPAVIAALVLLMAFAVAVVGASAVGVKWPGRDRRGIAAAEVLPVGAVPVGKGGPSIRAPLDITPPENYTPPSFGWRTPGPRGASAAAPAAYSGPPITGTVQSPEGKPLAGAEVMLVTHNPRPSSRPGGPPGIDYSVGTLGDGRFEIKPRRQPLALYVNAPQGCAWVTADTFKPDQVITLRQRGRLELTVKQGAKALGQARVMIYPANELQGAVLGGQSVTADDDGHATVERVFPGETRLVWTVEESSKLPAREIRVNVEAGKTHKVALGGVGRPVIGMIAGDVTAFDYHRGVLRLTKGADERAGRNGPIYFDLGGDGGFRVEDVQPGDYEIAIDLGTRLGKNIKIVETYAVARTTFKMPPIPGDFSDQPLDIGKVPVTEKKVLEVGEPFPKLAGKKPTGEPMSIGDFHGQILLVQAGDPTAGRSRGEVEWQHSVHGRFGHNPAFAMLTIITDQPVWRELAAGDGAAAAAAPAPAAWLWPVMRLDRLPEELETSTARMFLVDADGHVAAKNVTAAQVYAVLDQALESKADPRVKFDYVARREARQNPPFDKIPGPSADDAAAGARVSLVAGVPSWDTPKSDVNVLTDGRMPANEDAPAEALFFQAGTLEGRFRIDLAELTDVAEVRTYSWHKDTRAAQVYGVFGSDGTDENFDPGPDIGMDPTKHGWTSIAFVDTRPEMKPVGVQGVALGGRYVSSIADKEKGTLGRYRHLLFQVFVTEAEDVFGHTFYGEIDVIARK